MRTLKLGFVILLTACGSAPEGELGSVETPIINGLAPNRPEHAAVVSLHLKYVNAPLFSPSPFCSGTLIDDDWVLTAAHCVHRRKASTLAISTSDDPSTSFSPKAVSEVRVHPQYSSSLLINDVALLRLATALTGTTVPPLPANLGFTQGDVDAAINLNFAGFGYSDLAKTEFGVKLQVDSPLGALGCPTSLGCPDGISPLAATTQISYGQSEDGACNGDSGGPAFVDRNGTWYVGGVTSYGDGSCNVYGASTNVGAYASWIDGYVNPPPAPECSAAGASCASGAECCSGSCAGKPGQKTCK